MRSITSTIVALLFTGAIAGSKNLNAREFMTKINTLKNVAPIEFNDQLTPMLCLRGGFYSCLTIDNSTGKEIKTPNCTDKAPEYPLQPPESTTNKIGWACSNGWKDNMIFLNNIFDQRGLINDECNGERNIVINAENPLIQTRVIDSLPAGQFCYYKA